METRLGRPVGTAGLRNNKGQFVIGHNGNIKRRENKPCAFCGGEKTWKNKFCSHECYSKNKIGKKHWWGNQISRSLKGKKKTPEHIEKVRLALIGRKRPDMTGENHPDWKGDNVGYDALHDWVYRKLGLPQLCQGCGRKNEKINNRNCVHWANKSHLYKRILDDWISLCRKCHYQFDINTQTWQTKRWNK